MHRAVFSCAVFLVACTTSNMMPGDSGIESGDSGNDDSGMKDRTGSMMDAALCAPQDLGAWQPPPFVPPVPQQNVCNSAQIKSFYTFCVGPQATANQCQSFAAGAKKCDACLETAESELAWGALVLSADGYRPNAEGCIATLGFLECAKRARSLSACTDASCKSVCPPPQPPMDDGGNAALDACRSAAQTSVCKAFSADVDAACPIPLGKGEGSSVSECLQTDLQAFYMAFAPLLCGAEG